MIVILVLHWLAYLQSWIKSAFLEQNPGVYDLLPDKCRLDKGGWMSTNGVSTGIVPFHLIFCAEPSVWKITHEGEHVSPTATYNSE